MRLHNYSNLVNLPLDIGQIDGREYDMMVSVVTDDA